jgi:anthranilate phosphoribosyltransferase
MDERLSEELGRYRSGSLVQLVDELSSFGPSRVVEVKDGEVRQYMLRPEDVGLRTSAAEEVKAHETRAQTVEATL